MAEMLDTQENIDVLRSYLVDYDLEIAKDDLGLMLRHVDLVIAKNEQINLTRIVNPQDALVRHIVDSLLFVPVVDECALGPQDSFVDIGTGAGFPGIPLCIATKTKGTLIDSVGKKIAAVQGFVEQLGLTDYLTTRSIRAEELAREQRAVYRIVTARAVADLGVLVEYASPLLEAGGSLVVSKAQIQDAELARGIDTGKIVGMTLVSRETYELPYESGHREILRFDKTSKSKIKLPRTVGAAKHKPLVS